MTGNHPFDLEERLLDFSTLIIRLVEQMPNTLGGRHIAGQLIRSGTSPLANHGEAQEAESHKDFIHKMKIASKELKETMRWLRLIDKVAMIQDRQCLTPVMEECDQLIRIFIASIRTTQQRLSK